MQREDFIDYLKNVRGLAPNTAATRAGNCSTIETYEGDLDEHFERDGLEGILARLTYSKQDQRDGIPARHSIPIDGDIYNGTSTLKSALNLYIAFKNGEYAPVPRSPRPAASSRRSGRKKTTGEWPRWEQPGEKESLELAKILTRYVRFLSCEIVEAVTRDNECRATEWREALFQRGIDPELYLWEGSSCAFPGVRRYAGSKESSRLRDSNNDYSDISDALCLDDNDYPKQIWSFTFRNAQFSKFGPDGYRLAHLVDHKEHKNRMVDELSCSLPESVSFIPGLYTCPSNAAYVSGGLLLPTDFNARVRNLLQRRAAQLYGSVCNLFPDGFEVKACDDETWALEEFEWAPCVGGLEHIDTFLAFRENRMEKLFANSERSTK